MLPSDTNVLFPFIGVKVPVSVSQLKKKGCFLAERHKLLPHQWAQAYDGNNEEITYFYISLLGLSLENQLGLDYS